MSADDLTVKMGFEGIGLDIPKKIEESVRDVSSSYDKANQVLVMFNKTNEEMVRIIKQQVGPFAKLDTIWRKTATGIDKVTSSLTINIAAQQKALEIANKNAAVALQSREGISRTRPLTVEGTDSPKELDYLINRYIEVENVAKRSFTAQAQASNKIITAQQSVNAGLSKMGVYYSDLEKKSAQAYQSMIANAAQVNKSLTASLSQPSIEIQKLNAGYKELERTSAKAFIAQAQEINKAITAQQGLNVGLQKMGLYYKDLEIKSAQAYRSMLANAAQVNQSLTAAQSQRSPEIQRLNEYYKSLENSSAGQVAAQTKLINVQKSYADMQAKIATGQLKLVSTSSSVNNATGETTRKFILLTAAGRQMAVTTTGVNGKLTGMTTGMKDAAEATKGVMITWQGLIRMMTSIAIYRIVTRLSQSLIEATKQSAELSIKIAELQTISQNRPLIDDEWFDGLKRLSNEFGTDIFDQAEGAYQALSNQVVEGAETFKFMAAANKLALTTVASTTDAVNLLTAAINAYDLDVKDSDAIAASFFKTVELGRVRLAEMANTFGRIAVPASQLGVSLNELQAALDVATIKGIKFNQASTLVRNVLLKLIRPTTAMKSLFEEWGVNSGEAAIKAFGLSGVLAKLEERTKGNANELGDLFGRIRAITGAMIYAGNGVDKFNVALAELQTSQESYNKAAQIVLESTGKKFDRSVNQIKNFFLEQGRELLDFVSKWTGGFHGMVLAVQALIDTMKIFAAVATVFAIKATVAWIAALGPLSLVLLGVGAAVYGISLALRASESAIEREQKAWDASWASRDAELTKFYDNQLTVVNRGLDAQITAHTQEAAKVNAAWNVVFDKLEEAYDNNVKLAKLSLEEIGKSAEAQVKKIESAIKKAQKSLEKSREDAQKFLRTINEEIFKQSLEDKTPAQQFSAITKQLQLIEKQRKAALSAGDYDLAGTLLKEYKTLVIEQINLDREHFNEKKKLTDKAVEIQKKADEKTAELNRKLVIARRKSDTDNIRKLRSEINKVEADTKIKLAAIAKGQTDLSRSSLGAFFKNYEKILGDVSKIAITQQKIIEDAEIKKIAKLSNLREKFIKREIDFESAYKEFKAFKLDDVIEGAGGDPEKLAKAFKDRQDNLTKLQALSRSIQSEELAKAGLIQKTQAREELARLESIKLQEQAVLKQELLRIETDKLIKQREAIIELQRKEAKLQKENSERQARALLAVQLLLSEQLKTVQKLGEDILRGSGGEDIAIKNLVDALKELTSIKATDEIQKITDVQDKLNSSIAKFLELSTKRGSLQTTPFADEGIPQLTEDMLRFITKLKDAQKTVASGFIVNQVEAIKKSNEGLAEAVKLQLDAEEKIKQSRLIREAADAGITREQVTLNTLNTKLLEVDNQLLKNANARKTLIIEISEEYDNFTKKQQDIILKGTQIVPTVQLPQKFAAGGSVHGTDSIPAMLSPGEFVMNAASSRKFYSQLMSMNNSTLGFASGGPVTSMGDININYQSQGSTESDIVAIGNGLRREIRRGRLKF